MSNYSRCVMIFISKRQHFIGEHLPTISRLWSHLVPYEPNIEFGDYPLNQKDIYREFKLRGYEYVDQFKSILKIGTSLKIAEVLWTGNWCTFLDSLFQFRIFQKDTRLLYSVMGVNLIKIDKIKHLEYSKNNIKILTAYYCKETDMIKCGGVELYGFQIVPISKKKLTNSILLENYKFVPNNINTLTFHESLRINLQIIIENLDGTKLKCFEIMDKSIESFGTILKIIAKTLPKIQLIFENKRNEKTNNFHLICGTNLSLTPLIFNQLEPYGFILSWEDNTLDSNVNYLTIHEISHRKLCLFRKFNSNTIKWNPIKMSDNSDWLNKCQKEFNKNLLLYNNQNESVNGSLGFYNCLRMELKTNVCCFLIDGSAPKFDLSSDFYQKQLKKDMNVNVFLNGCWGTYCYLLLTELPKTIYSHYYINLKTCDNLSEFEWSRAPTDHTYGMVHVHYTTLENKDVIIANNYQLVENYQESYGYSGIINQDKVMGIAYCDVLTNYIKPDDWMTWKIPSDWSLAEAATVPVAYTSILYALKIISHLKPNQTILIHSGCDEIGQAAIRVALHLGCHVYTTVSGTNKKREFLKRLFPELSDSHIGCSDNNQFSYWLHSQTNGRGIDCVLNSLTGRKQLASLHSLARGGTFLEIGQVDLLKNETIKLLLIKKQINFHSIMLDKIVLNKPRIKNKIYTLLQNGIENGYVVPISKTIFYQKELNKAFKYMTTEEYIGEILIYMMGKFESKPQFYCKPDVNYIIIDGLDDLGLELADWLVLKGAKNLILTTKTGLKTGYHNYRITSWKLYGINVKILKLDASNYLECQQILEKSSKLCSIDGIFNPIIVHNDVLSINQTAVKFECSIQSKIIATKNLDFLSRKYCPKLRYFVLFLSVICGDDNFKQTNCGYSNSIMARICEDRKKLNLPGMVIQWNVIPNVDTLGDLDQKIFGIVGQKFGNSTKMLDDLLLYPEPVVSCRVIRKKLKESNKLGNVLDVVIRILGIKIKTVSFHSTLPELGMDSMTSFEISQALENEYQIYLTQNDLRNMSLNGLLKFQEIEHKVVENEIESLEYILEFIDDDFHKILVPLKNGTNNRKSIIYCLPGIEGALKPFKSIINMLDHQIFGFHYPKHIEKLSDIIDCLLVPIIDNSIEIPITFIAHSFGTLIALQLTSKLENLGYQVKIICLDGSPMLASILLEKLFQNNNRQEFETDVILKIVVDYAFLNSIKKHRDTIINGHFNTFGDRFKVVQELVGQKMPKIAYKYLPYLVEPMYKRIKAFLESHQEYPLVESNVYLFKPKVMTVNNLPNDYGLKTICTNLIDFGNWPGNHFTIMKNNEMAVKICDLLSVNTC